MNRDWFAWLTGSGPRLDEVVQDAEPLERDTSFSVRMVEAIRMETTTEQHVELLQLSNATQRSKAEIIRAALAMAMPAFKSNPAMIDLLQPGAEQSHNGLEKGNAQAGRIAGHASNGMGR